MVEARLQETEQTFRNLIDSLEDGYFEVDLKGMFTLVNDAYCRMTGWQRDELLGQSFKELLPSADQDQGDDPGLHARSTRPASRSKRSSTRSSASDGSTRGRRRHGQPETRQPRPADWLHRDPPRLHRAARWPPSGCAERGALSPDPRQHRGRLLRDRSEPEGPLRVRQRRVLPDRPASPREELIGQSYVQVLRRRHRRAALRRLSPGLPDRRAAEGAGLRAGRQGRHRRGYVEESVSLRKDASGAVVGFMGIRRDCHGAHRRRAARSPTRRRRPRPPTARRASSSPT